MRVLNAEEPFYVPNIGHSEFLLQEVFEIKMSESQLQMNLRSSTYRSMITVPSSLRR